MSLKQEDRDLLMKACKMATDARTRQARFEKKVMNILENKLPEIVAKAVIENGSAPSAKPEYGCTFDFSKTNVPPELQQQISQQIAVSVSGVCRMLDIQGSLQIKFTTNRHEN